MAFTYAGTLSTNLDKVRFYIGDKTVGAGPRPAEGNYTDDEIEGVLALGSSWQETVADMFDTLAAEWIIFPSFQADNFSISRSHIAKNFQSQAEWWRKNHGLASPQKQYGAPGSRPVTRADSYSDDKDSVTE